MPEPHPPSPEVLTQIRALPRSGKPLVVCDVDEVILHLVQPIERHLNAQGFGFIEHKYKFHGNIAPLGSQTPLADEEVTRQLHTFFDRESHRQPPVEGAAEGLARITGTHEVVLLTNLPGAHNKPVRERLLADLGIHYPVLTNSGPKGGAVAALAAGRPAPVVFIDDSARNHASVKASLPSAVLIRFIADQRFRRSVEPEAHIDLLTGDWHETADFVASILERI